MGSDVTCPHGRASPSVNVSRGKMRAVLGIGLYVKDARRRLANSSIRYGSRCSEHGLGGSGEAGGRVSQKTHFNETLREGRTAASLSLYERGYTETIRFSPYTNQIGVLRNIRSRRADALAQGSLGMKLLSHPLRLSFGVCCPVRAALPAVESVSRSGALEVRFSSSGIPLRFVRHSCADPADYSFPCP